MTSGDIGRTLRRMSHELLELNQGSGGLLLLGILTRGAPLAHRIGVLLAEAEGHDVPVGELDITMYRDDLRRHPAREVGHTQLPVRIDGQRVVLVDDVLYSGRTIQAALLALADLGRPAAVELMTLVDRGHREVPIQPHIVGRTLSTTPDQRVRVHVAEIDGADEVIVEGATT
ncbi:MAG: bifunctional pyr operon transcriptional regulator/uracil phosphoribosyltransferase PyrR [Arachnia sp.]